MRNKYTFILLGGISLFTLGNGISKLSDGGFNLPVGLMLVGGGVGIIFSVYGFLQGKRAL